MLLGPSYSGRVEPREFASLNSFSSMKKAVSCFPLLIMIGKSLSQEL